MTKIPNLFLFSLIFKNKKWVLAVPVFSFLVLFSMSFQHFRLNWGDPWSDGNVLTSGRYFNEAGFLKARLTPILDVGILSEKSLRYTHYPPMPDILNGILQKCGLTDLYQFRWVALIFSVGSIIFFYYFVADVFGLSVALIAVVLMCTNFIWFQFADCLHHVPLYTFFQNASFLLAIRWLKGRKNWTIVIYSFTVWFAYLCSYDVWLYLPIVIIGCIKFAEKKRSDPESIQLLIVTAAAMTVAVSVKFGLVCWSLGSIQRFYDDFLFQSEERGILQLVDQFGRSEFFKSVIYKILRFYSPLFYLVLLIQLSENVILRFYRKKYLYQEKLLQFKKYSLIFLFAVIPFFIIFPQIIVEQSHPFLMLLPYFCISSAILIKQLYLHPYAKRFGVSIVLIVFLFFWQLCETIALKKAFIDTESFKEIKNLSEFNPQSNIILTDLPIDSIFRYYLDKHLLGLPLLAGMDEISILNKLNHVLNSFDLSHILFVSSTHPDLLKYEKSQSFREPSKFFNPINFIYPRALSKLLSEDIADSQNNFIKLIKNNSYFKMEGTGFSVYNISSEKINSRLDELEVQESNLKLVELRSTQLFDQSMSGVWTSGSIVLAGHQPTLKFEFKIDGNSIFPSGQFSIQPTAIRIGLAPDRDYMATVDLSSLCPNQTLSIEVNGRLLRKYSFSKINTLSQVKFRIPHFILRPKRSQTLILRFSKFNLDQRAAQLMGIHFLPLDL